MEKTQKAEEMLRKIGAEDIEFYNLVNNFGFTYRIGTIKFDSRFWRNCYGVNLDTFRTSTSGNTEGIEDLQELVVKIDYALNKIYKGDN